MRRLQPLSVPEMVRRAPLAALLVGLGSACSEHKVEVSNASPEATITAPTDGSSVEAGAVVAMGSVSDPDEGPDDLVTSWWLNGEVVCPDEAPEEFGSTACLMSLDEGEAEIKLQVRDSGDAVSMDVVTVRVGSGEDPPNTGPTCAITAPELDSILSPTEEVLLAGTASDPDQEAHTLSAGWESDSGGVIGDSPPNSDGTVQVVADPLTPGLHILTLTITDALGEQCVDSVSVRVGTAPALAEVSISPSPAWADDALLCSWTFEDSVATDTSTASWTINGVAAGEGPSLAAGHVHGDTVACTVTPSDGALEGDAVTASLVISNSPPVVDAVLITPSAPTAADTLTCSYTGFADLDGEPDASTLRWQVGGVDAGPGSTLSGTFVRGDVVSCTVTPSDGVDDGVPVMASVTIGNTAPEVLAASLSPEAVYTDTMLTGLVTTTDAEGDGVTLSYAWTVDGIPAGEGASSLSGLLHFDKHQVVSLVVTPSDGLDDGAPVSAGSRTVRNSPPLSPTLLITPEAPAEGVDDVWCSVDSPSADADADTISYTFDWTLDGLPWSGAVLSTSEPGDTIPLSETTAGQEWTCTVTPSDGEEPGSPASVSVLIDNAETRVFVTSYATSSNMGGPSGGDEFCTTVADEAGLGGSWVAYLSGGGATAITRIPDGPYVRLDGMPIADDQADLTDGSIANPINITELGGVDYGFVCTGSSESGHATGPATASGGNCQGWTRGCGVCDGDHWYVEVGRADRTSDDWSTAGWNFCGSCKLYCFET